MGGQVNYHTPHWHGNVGAGVRGVSEAAQWSTTDDSENWFRASLIDPMASGSSNSWLS